MEEKLVKVCHKISEKPNGSHRHEKSERKYPRNDNNRNLLNYQAPGTRAGTIDRGAKTFFRKKRGRIIFFGKK